MWKKSFPLLQHTGVKTGIGSRRIWKNQCAALLKKKMRQECTTLAWRWSWLNLTIKYTPSSVCWRKDGEIGAVEKEVEEEKERKISVDLHKTRPRHTVFHVFKWFSHNFNSSQAYLTSLNFNLLQVIGHCVNETGMFTVSSAKSEFLMITFTLFFFSSRREYDSTPRHRLYVIELHATASGYV